MKIAHNKTNTETEKEIVKLYKEGSSSIILSKKFGVHFSTVLNIVKRNNIQIRKMRDAKKIYHYDENFFENIDTEEKAYWVGFILADGCLSIRNNYKKDLSIGLKDKGHLQKFVSSINGNNKIRTYTWKRRQYEAISIRCPKIIEDLLNLGMTPRKSLIAKVPPIREELSSHFWRGVVDGDGSMGIYINRKRYNHKSFALSLVGSNAVISEFIRYIQNNTGIILVANSSRRIFVAKTTNASAIRIIKLLYENATMFMDRKFKLAKHMIKEWQSSSNIS